MVKYACHTSVPLQCPWYKISHFTRSWRCKYVINHDDVIDVSSKQSEYTIQKNHSFSIQNILWQLTQYFCACLCLFWVSIISAFHFILVFSDEIMSIHVYQFVNQPILFLIIFHYFLFISSISPSDYRVYDQSSFHR